MGRHPDSCNSKGRGSNCACVAVLVMMFVDYWAFNVKQ